MAATRPSRIDGVSLPTRPARALVIVPTDNEADNVRELVPEILSQGPEFEVLIVDDNSTDGTGQIVDEMRETETRLHVLHRPGKMGLGTAYVDGFRYALRKDYDFIYEMDADFSHDPASHRTFIDTAEKENVDLVLGSRYLNGVTVVNGLDATLTHLVYRDGNAAYHLTAPLAPGGNQTLTPGGGDTATIVPASLKIGHKFAEVLKQQPADSYLAVLDRSPFWEPGVPELLERGSFHLVLGWPKGQR